MSHPEINNATPYAFENLYLLDEEGRALLVAVVKATFSVDAAGSCTLAEKQAPVQVAGETFGDPATTSYRYEPELAFIKLATDVVLIGHAYPRRETDTEVSVTLEAGPLAKRAQVFGDRSWIRVGNDIAISPAQRFVRMPLCYERAFGGWDRSAPDPARHVCDRRNPVGTGFRADGSFEEGVRLPNVEDPKARIQSPQDRPEPVGFGFTSPDWLNRAQWAGTYDEAWQRERAPLLPRDFDRRFFNSASAGLVAPEYFRGDEPIAASGVLPGAERFVATLPGKPSPAVAVHMRTGAAVNMETVLDTVILEPDERRVQLVWRGHVRLRSGPHDVRAIDVA
jgi:hypothetical protein